jgi:hypothetical protein
MPSMALLIFNQVGLFLSARSSLFASTSISSHYEHINKIKFGEGKRLQMLQRGLFPSHQINFMDMLYVAPVKALKPLPPRCVHGCPYYYGYALNTNLYYTFFPFQHKRIVCESEIIRLIQALTPSKPIVFDMEYCAINYLLHYVEF